jgi:hypothetical protein
LLTPNRKGGSGLPPSSSGSFFLFLVLIALGVTLSQHQALEGMIQARVPKPLSGIGVNIDPEQSLIVGVATGSLARPHTRPSAGDVGGGE